MHVSVIGIIYRKVLQLWRHEKGAGWCDVARCWWWIFHVRNETSQNWINIDGIFIKKVALNFVSEVSKTKKENIPRIEPRIIFKVHPRLNPKVHRFESLFASFSFLSSWNFQIVLNCLPQYFLNPFIHKASWKLSTALLKAVRKLIYWAFKKLLWSGNIENYGSLWVFA